MSLTLISQALKVYLVNDKDQCRDVSMKTIREMMRSPASMFELLHRCQIFQVIGC